VQRVDTEILKIYIHLAQHHAFLKPIGLAISDFGGNLSQGISFAITGIAFMIPWVIVLVISVWGSRKLRRRWKETKTGA